MEKILFRSETEELPLYVLDSTKLAGREFLLVTDVEEGDGDCFILEEISDPASSEAVYQMVEDDTLLDHLANIFAEQTDNIDILF